MLRHECATVLFARSPFVFTVVFIIVIVIKAERKPFINIAATRGRNAAASPANMRAVFQLKRKT